MRKLYIFMAMLVSLAMFVSCRGVMGLSDTPEGVANEFLRSVYQLEFGMMPQLASDGALLQVALLEGASDGFSEQERGRYLQSRVLVTDFFMADDASQAKASYQVTFADGSTLDNSITLQRNKQRRWQVVAFDKPIIRPHIYTYFTNN